MWLAVQLRGVLVWGRVSGSSQHANVQCVFARESCSWRSRRPDSSVVLAEEARLGVETRLYPARNALMCGSACSPPPGGRHAWPGQVPRRGLMCSRFRCLCNSVMCGSALGPLRWPTSLDRAAAWVSLVNCFLSMQHPGGRQRVVPRLTSQALRTSCQRIPCQC